MKKKKPLTNKQGEVRELKTEDFKRFRAAEDVLPHELLKVLPKRKPGQRGKQKKPTKEQITLRLSHDVLQQFRDTGSGWQSRLDAALKDWVRHHPPA